MTTQTPETNSANSKLPQRFSDFESLKEAFTDQISTVAEKVKTFAPKSGGLGRMGESFSEGLTAVTEYLENHTAADVGHHLVDYMKKHPYRIAATVLGAGLGFLAVKRWEENRQHTGALQ